MSMSVEQVLLCSSDMKRKSVPVDLASESGERMRVARLSAFGDKSQGDVARLMVVSQSDISRWETGKRAPSVVDFVRFARACAVPPEKILSGIAPTAAEQLRLS